MSQYQSLDMATIPAIFLNIALAPAVNASTYIDIHDITYVFICSMAFKELQHS
jgi:hypothetical protein